MDLRAAFEALQRGGHVGGFTWMAEHFYAYNDEQRQHVEAAFAYVRDVLMGGIRLTIRPPGVPCSTPPPPSTPLPSPPPPSPLLPPQIPDAEAPSASAIAMPPAEPSPRPPLSPTPPLPKCTTLALPPANLEAGLLLPSSLAPGTPVPAFAQQHAPPTAAWPSVKASTPWTTTFDVASLDASQPSKAEPGSQYASIARNEAPFKARGDGRGDFPITQVPLPLSWLAASTVAGCLVLGILFRTQLGTTLKRVLLRGESAHSSGVQSHQVLTPADERQHQAAASDDDECPEADAVRGRAGPYAKIPTLDLD